MEIRYLAMSVASDITGNLEEPSILEKELHKAIQDTKKRRGKSDYTIICLKTD